MKIKPEEKENRLYLKKRINPFRGMGIEYFLETPNIPISGFSSEKKGIETLATKITLELEGKTFPENIKIESNGDFYKSEITNLKKYLSKNLPGKTIY